MKLKLVKHGEFLGTVCDFYVDEENNIYMSRTQIGYALQYKQPQHAILMVHQRHKERLDKFSVEIRGSQFVTPIYKNKNADKVFMYSERGIYEVCRWSNQKVADEFNDWVYETIQSIKKNGYYISSEKDNKWLGIRNESKQARRYETDQIKLFVEYAKEQGSKSADRYYVLFTKLINGKMGIQSGKRDELSQETLMELKSLETLVKMRIRKLMEKKIPYKKIYQDVKMLVEEF
jgi:prophage antirepressor-like protein|nr:MAG TPA: antirepressor [Caudoviricetes sp.]